MKRLAAVLLVLAFAAGAVFASVDMSLALGGTATYGQLSISGGENQRTQFTPEFLIDAELDMDFHKGHGMMVGITPVFGNSTEIGVSVGYAYQTRISESCDLIAAVGPEFVFSQSGVDLNFFGTVDFDFDITQNLYVRVGTGLIVELGELGRDYASTWDFIIPLPAIAIGWNF